MFLLRGFAGLQTGHGYPWPSVPGVWINVVPLIVLTWPFLINWGIGGLPVAGINGLTDVAICGTRPVTSKL